MTNDPSAPGAKRPIDHTAASPLDGLGLFGVLGFGLSIWAEEMKWLGKKLFRQLEIRQLEKRLTQELTLLGRLTNAPDPDQGELELARKQAEFLEAEIAGLREDFEARRGLFLAERRKRLGFDKD